ncbi:hypothetical protein ACHAXR_011394 [Thalassiosira sp. AJA248-18]
MMDHVTSVVANTAFSLTLSGNSGISPFLTMFLIGMAGKIRPEYLNLDETMEKIMTSWPSLCFWSIMTILESVGKCVPVLDQIMDSAEAFIVPILDMMCTFSAFGSFESNGDGTNNNGTNEQDVTGDGYNEQYNNKRDGVNAFLRVILVFFGIILALSIHFFKMLIRLFGEGCLTQCITVLEATTVCISVLVSIFVRQFAIFVATCMLLAAGYNAKRRWDKWQDKKEQQQALGQQQGRGISVEDHDNHATSTEIPSAVTDEYVKMDEAEAEAEASGSAQLV